MVSPDSRRFRSTLSPATQTDSVADAEVASFWAISASTAASLIMLGGKGTRLRIRFFSNLLRENYPTIQRSNPAKKVRLFALKLLKENS